MPFSTRILPLAEEPGSLREQLPFDLLHHPPLEGFRGVVVLDRDGALEDNRAAVADLVDEVDGWRR